MHPSQGKQIGEVKVTARTELKNCSSWPFPLAAHNHPSSCRRGCVSSFDVKGFCRDKPLVVEEVIREVVEILNRIYTNPHFDKSLRRGCEIDKQDLRGAVRFDILATRWKQGSLCSLARTLTAVLYLEDRVIAHLKQRPDRSAIRRCHASTQSIARRPAAGWRWMNYRS
jgi:hypothetical protein